MASNDWRAGLPVPTPIPLRDPSNSGLRRVWMQTYFAAQQPSFNEAAFNGLMKESGDLMFKHLYGKNKAKISTRQLHDAIDKAAWNVFYKVHFVVSPTPAWPFQAYMAGRESFVQDGPSPELLAYYNMRNEQAQAAQPGTLAQAAVPQPGTLDKGKGKATDDDLADNMRELSVAGPSSRATVINQVQAPERPKQQDPAGMVRLQAKAEQMKENISKKHGRNRRHRKYLPQRLLATGSSIASGSVTSTGTGTSTSTSADVWQDAATIMANRTDSGPWLDLEQAAAALPRLQTQETKDEREVELQATEAAVWAKISEESDLGVFAGTGLFEIPFELPIPEGIDVFGLLRNRYIVEQFKAKTNADVTYKVLLATGGSKTHRVRVMIDRGYKGKADNPFLKAHLRQLWLLFVSWTIEAFSGRVVAVDTWVDSKTCADAVVADKTEAFALHMELISAITGL